MMVISSLMAEDYVKFRGQTVYRYLTVLADENEEVSCSNASPLLDLSNSSQYGCFISQHTMAIHCKSWLTMPNAQIRSFVESFFTRILIPRQHGLFADVFVKSICALNCWKGHPLYDRRSLIVADVHVKVR